MTTKVLQIWSQLKSPSVWLNQKSRERLSERPSVMVPMEQGTPGRAIVGGGQPAAEEQDADMGRASRGFVDPIPLLELFHVRVPLPKS